MVTSCKMYVPMWKISPKSTNIGLAEDSNEGSMYSTGSAAVAAKYRDPSSAKNAGLRMTGLGWAGVPVKRSFAPVDSAFDLAQGRLKGGCPT